MAPQSGNSRDTRSDFNQHPGKIHVLGRFTPWLGLLSAFLLLFSFLSLSLDIEETILHSEQHTV